MKKLYMIMQQNIQNEIIEGRKSKFGPEQIVIFIKPMDGGVWDSIGMINLTIGIKVKKNNKYYGEVVAFADDEVTQENVELVVKYLVNKELEQELVEGRPLAPRSLAHIRLEEQ